MMKTALMAKLCFNTDRGPTSVKHMLELHSIKKSDWHLIEEAITDEMLQDFEFVEWLTEKIKQWQITFFDLDIWKRHAAYFAPNSDLLLETIFKRRPKRKQESKESKIMFPFANDKINEWNDSIRQFGITPHSTDFLPNKIQAILKDSGLMDQMEDSNFEFAVPFLPEYLTLYAKRFGANEQGGGLVLLLTEIINANKNVFQIVSINKFFLVRKNVGGIKKIHNCEEEDWKHFLPQYRCTALCDGSTQCSRFAKPHSDFCLYHIQNPPAQIKKRVCKDPCPTSKKADYYHQNPFEIPSSLALYPKTARLVSDLPQYNPRNSWIENEWYLPCVRYDSLYYSHSEQDNTKYCGKFFYYEPHSSTAIRLGKSLFCATKVQAWLRLDFLVNGPGTTLPKKVTKLHKRMFPQFLHHGQYSSAIFDEHGPYSSATYEDVSLFEEIKRILKEDCGLAKTKHYLDTWLTFHFSTLFLSLEETFDCADDICIPVFFPSIRPDAKFDLRFVGAFDFLDQPICSLARQLGLDTVIFQHEVGSHDCVTKIMHVNPNFAKDLYQIQDQTTTNVKGQSILPKIWFPKDDGILTFHNQHMQNVPLDHPDSIFQYYESNVPRKIHGTGYMRDTVHEFEPKQPKRKEVLFHTR